jgi:hypothetical protein
MYCHPFHLCSESERSSSSSLLRHFQVILSVIDLIVDLTFDITHKIPVHKAPIRLSFILKLTDKFQKTVAGNIARTTSISALSPA